MKYIWKKCYQKFFWVPIGLLDQLLLFSQLYLIELLGLLTGLGLLELWHLIYPKRLIGFGMLVFFTNLSLMEFQVRYLALFLLFSVIYDFKMFWMESLHKNIQLMREFLKAPFLVLHFSYYTLMIFLTMVSVILLSMLMILLSIRASDLWQQLELASELESDLRDTVDWVKKWLVGFNAGKTQLVSFDRSNNNGSVDVKMGGSILEKKSSFKMLGWTFSSKLDWGSSIISIAKTASKKIGALIRSMKFLSPEVALYLYKSTIRPCMEYCCHVWAGAPSCYLYLLDKLEKRICRIVGPSLAASLEPLAHRRNMASLSLFYRYYFGRCSSELAKQVPLPFSRGKSTCYSDRLHDFSVTILRCYKDVYVNRFFPRTARLWNALPIECFLWPMILEALNLELIDIF